MNTEKAILQLRELAEKQADTQNDLVTAVAGLVKIVAGLADTLDELTKIKERTL